MSFYVLIVKIIQNTLFVSLGNYLSNAYAPSQGLVHICTSSDTIIQDFLIESGSKTDFLINNYVHV